MLSIIIPSYNDPFLENTIESVLKNALGKIQLVPVLDGFPPTTPLPKDNRIEPIFLPKHTGMRGAINAGIKKSRGKFIMKCDSHCAFASGFDKAMARTCQKNWLMIPRRYSLNEKLWQKDEGRPPRDYHFISYPMPTRDYGICISSQDWLGRATGRTGPEYDIDDTMTFQGSCWFADRRYFMSHIGYLDDKLEAYTPFGGEQLEIGLKYWLGGGEVKVIKTTWYAHLNKRPEHYRKRMFSRSYKVNSKTKQSRAWQTSHWLNNKEPDMIHPFSWLVEKFWPVPTWPDDRKLWVFPKS